MKTKKELRGEILKKRRQMTEEQVREKSRIICDAVSRMELYQKAEKLCIYMPINNEADPMPLIAPAKKEGKKIYVPKVLGETMIFNAYEEDLMREEGAFHIRESLSEEVLEPDELTLVLMPGSVFDVHGNRIGYGGGYYDRYLQQWPDCRTCAICFDFQILEEIPSQDHDIRPEYIVSEARILCGDKGEE